MANNPFKSWLVFWLYVSAALFAIIFLILFLSPRKDDKIKITILQINDVYEIVPLDKGHSGGLARVARVCKDLRSKNNGTFISVLAGDFLSPSAIGTLKDPVTGD